MYVLLKDKNFFFAILCMKFLKYRAAKLTDVL